MWGLKFFSFSFAFSTMPLCVHIVHVFFSICCLRDALHQNTFVVFVFLSSHAFAFCARQASFIFFSQPRRHQKSSTSYSNVHVAANMFCWLKLLYYITVENSISVARNEATTCKSTLDVKQSRCTLKCWCRSHQIRISSLTCCFKTALMTNRQNNGSQCLFKCSE